MTTSSNGSITSRPMRDEDFARMRQLLIDAVSSTPVGFNWDVRRLDGKRYYEAHVDQNRLLERPVQLWENAAGELVAFVLPESSDDAHLQVHPDYRHLEAELVAWAEDHLSAVDAESNRRQLQIYTYEYDALRQQTLTERGYTKMEYGGMIRHLRLGKQPRPHMTLAEGYTLRTTQPDDIEDCQRIADILNAAFNRTFHNAEEFQNFARRAPSFRSDLDLVAVAPDGIFAAYVGIPYDEANRWGIFEPVCTHPDHRRKGLARALMNEGLRRLWALGAVEASVDTGDMVPANSLYTAMGFTEAYKGYSWRKQW
jgi:GNAT superfamily N-acetyltransferase